MLRVRRTASMWPFNGHGEPYLDSTDLGHPKAGSNEIGVVGKMGSRSILFGQRQSAAFRNAAGTVRVKVL